MYWKDSAAYFHASFIHAAQIDFYHFKKKKMCCLYVMKTKTIKVKRNVLNERSVVCDALFNAEFPCKFRTIHCRDAAWTWTQRFTTEINEKAVLHYSKINVSRVPLFAVLMINDFICPMFSLLGSCWEKDSF